MCLLCDCACVCVTVDSLQCNWNNFTDRGPKTIQHCGSLWRDPTCFPNLASPFAKQGTLRTGRCYFQCDLQLFCKKEMTTYFFLPGCLQKASYSCEDGGEDRSHLTETERGWRIRKGGRGTVNFFFFLLCHMSSPFLVLQSPSSPPELLETRRAARAPDLPTDTLRYDAQTASDSSINDEPRCLKTLRQEVR